MDAIEALRERRTVRAYEPGRSIPVDHLETIVDCGRLASTARNTQPWTFIVVTEPDILKRIAEITEHGKHIAQASACIAVLCEDSRYYLEDGCAATQNMLTASWALGLGACWVAGDKKAYADMLCGLLGAPATEKLVSLIALGYPAKIPSPSKRPLAEVLHWEHY